MLSQDITGTVNINNGIMRSGTSGGDYDYALHDGVVLIQQFSDQIIISAETALDHNPAAVVTPQLNVEMLTTEKISLLEL